MYVITALLPLIGLISLGFILKQRHFVSEGFWRDAEKLNYYILFPALLFSSLAWVELKLQQLTNVLGVVVLTIAVVSAVLWGLKVALQLEAKEFGVYVQSHIRFNTYIGLSLMGILFAAPGMQMFSMIIAVAIPIVNILSVLALLPKQQRDLKQSLMTVVKNPLILGCVAGIGFNLSGLSLADALQQWLKLLAGCSLPLGLLAVGAALQFDALKQAFNALILNSLGRLVLVPLCAYGVAQGFHLSPFEMTVVMVFFALPTASSAYVLTRHLKGNAELMAGVISLQTVLFVGSLPLLMWALHG